MKFSAAAVMALALAPTSMSFVAERRTFVRTNSLVTLRSTSAKNNLMNNARPTGITSSDIEEMVLSSESSAGKILKESNAAEFRSSLVAYLSQFEGQSGAHIIYSKLVENGVKVVNGFSGGAILPLLDQFHETHPRHESTGGVPPIRWITNSNENSAGHIAEGYAKSQPLNSEHLPVGVVVATSGPGVTNLITPLQDAICDGVPLVFLCGQAATTAPIDAFQSAPAVDLTRPCTKWSYQIKSAAELPLVMDYAFFIARHGRPGPVFIDLPKDLQIQSVTSDLLDKFASTYLRENGDQTAFVRAALKQRRNGDLFHVLEMGYPDKRLPFEVLKEGSSGYKLVPVSDLSDVGSFYEDHHPSNRLFEYTFTGRNDAGGSYREDNLEPNGVLTQKLLDLILQAKRPIIIAGQGCNDANLELAAFAEKLQIPVTTTLHALGCFDERHPLALKMMGMHGHATPNFMVQESDLILCIGSRFDDRITGRTSDFAPEAKKAGREGRGGIVHVDIRLTEKGKQVRPKFFVHSTGKQFLRTMNEALEKKRVKQDVSAWLQRMKDLQRDFPVKIPEFQTDMIKVPSGETLSRTRMSAQSVITEMNKQLLFNKKIDDAIFTTGVGVHQMIAAQLITWTQPRQMLSSGSLGTMGVSLGYSIGAKLANGGKVVISVDGDGSFNMTFTELKTLAEQKIAVKLLILDNDGQMMVEYWQRLFHENRLLAVRNSVNPDYSTLAKAFGIKSIYCDCEEELEEKMKEFLFEDPDEPVLFHVKIQRTPCLPMVAPGQPLQDMILEDVNVDVDGAAAPS